MFGRLLVKLDKEHKKQKKKNGAYQYDGYTADLPFSDRYWSLNNTDTGECAYSLTNYIVTCIVCMCLNCKRKTNMLQHAVIRLGGGNIGRDRLG
jgi:hypothetical protein